MDDSEVSEIKLKAGSLALKRMDEEHVVIVESKSDQKKILMPDENKLTNLTGNGTVEGSDAEETVPDSEPNSGNVVTIPPILPGVSELTGDDDLSVASMSSFSVHSHRSLRHRNYHESLLHNPSQTPRVMYIPTPGAATRQQSTGLTSTVDTVATTSTVSWTGPVHPSIQEGDENRVVIVATLVEPEDSRDPEENITSEQNVESGSNDAQVYPLVVATEEKPKRTTWQDRKAKVIFSSLFFISFTAIIVLSIFLSRSGDKTNPDDRTSSNPLPTLSPTKDPLKPEPSLEEWNELKETLEDLNSFLIGPVIDNEYLSTCEISEVDFYLVAAVPVCLQFHECRHKFCISQLNAGSNLPIYIADTRSEEAVQVALQFASTHNIKASVKATGFSYTGSSTNYESLMIFVNKFPKDGTIKKDYMDSCGTTYDTAIALGPGEWADDVLEQVGTSYLPSFLPFTRAISATGGYLQGGGISLAPRTHGLAVDHVIDFHVTLANGTSVIANKCTNADLFWALKGGGGGTFGVVTKVHYELEPKTPFVTLVFSLHCDKHTVPTIHQNYVFAVESWLRFWIEKSPHLDNRWNGNWGPTFCYLWFFGPREEALFVDELTEWFNNVISKLLQANSGWSAQTPQAQEFDSWYYYKGGSIAYRNSFYAAEGFNQQQRNITSRLISLEHVENEPEDLLTFFMDLSSNGTKWTAPNFLLGGKINQVPVEQSSVHPMIRKSLFGIYVLSYEEQKKMKQYFQKFNETAVMFNFRSIAEENWKQVQWGSNYPKLLRIKQQYDPQSTFDCIHCVGYSGIELPQEYYN